MMARMTDVNMRTETRTLCPGVNCWRINRADRVALLIDGDAYFRAFRAAVAQAKHSVIILGWDFDTRLETVRDSPTDPYPSRLDDFLRVILAQRPALHVYVLNWDYHMIYALEREWLSRYKLSRLRRFHFHMDDDHPVGASQHQKVVVVDDAVAFVGGFDLAKCRWDTQEHRPHDPRRNYDDPSCLPFHDVQAAVSGEVARSLGELARERWTRATGERMSPPPADLAGDPWPRYLKPEMASVPVGIARTEPQHGGRREVREVERLHLDSIKAARRFIYIETQYLTCNRVADALADRLKEPGGPQIVLILHPNSGGWLEQHTMDVLRERVLRFLREADRHGRLRVYYPHVPGLTDQCIVVHSKVLIIDDEFLRVGSANISNRSMGFDTECDLAIEAAGDAGRSHAIAAFRARLLAEHLGASPESVAEEFRRAPSGIAAVEAFRGGERTLRDFTSDISPDESWLPDGDLIDPDWPLDADAVVDHVLSHDHRKRARGRIVFAAAMIVLVLALAAAWRWTPMKEWLDLETLTQRVAELRQTGAGPLIVIGGFVVGGLVVAPVTVLIAATVLTFGPWLGFAYSFIGMTLSALVTYGLGRLVGRDMVKHLAGRRLNRLSLRLAQKGVLTVVAIRILPVAPFTIVNMVAGASHIRFRDFLVGTVIGELPGLLALSAFFDQIWATIRNPGPTSFVILAAVIGAIIAGAIALRR